MFLIVLFAQAEGGVSYGLPTFFFLLSLVVTIGFWLYFRHRQVIIQSNVDAALSAKAASEQNLKDQFGRIRQQDFDSAKATLQSIEDELAKLNGQFLGKTEECASLMQEKAKLVKTVQELEKHKEFNPAFRKQIYNVGIIGIAASGKTALLMRLIDPLVMDIKNFGQTGVDETHERSVTLTHNHSDFVRIEHLIRFHEWGGEHLPEAQRDMLKMSQRDVATEKDGVTDLAGIQGIIFAVDLGDFIKDEKGRPVGPQRFNPQRISTQVEEYFSSLKMPFLLNDTVLSRCHVVILFINKIDLMVGQFEENCKIAEKQYEKLILGLRNQCGRTPVEVVVGSAETDIGLTKLYATLVQKIMPESAKRGNLGKAQQQKIKPITGPGESKMPKPAQATPPTSSGSPPSDSAASSNVPPGLAPPAGLPVPPKAK